jgi:hypothetical protein
MGTEVVDNLVAVAKRRVLASLADEIAKLSEGLIILDEIG